MSVATFPSALVTYILICLDLTFLLSLSVGKVAIWRASNNTLLGYITRKFNIHNMYTAGTLAVTGLNVQLPEDLTENVLFEMTALSGPSSAFPLVGGAGHPSYYDFTPWRLGFV